MCTMTELFAQCEPAVDSTPLEEDEFFGFRVVGRQQRPAEFLQCWLDLVRVVFEPALPGTMFLNSNWDLLTAAVPERPFKLGYVSVTGDIGESGVTGFCSRYLLPRAAELGVALYGAVGCFAALCVGDELYKQRVALNRELQRVFGAGFAVEVAFGALSSAAAGDPILPTSQEVAHAGIALDASVGPGVVRLSLWLLEPLSAAH
jgi:hypothetical protein